MAQTKLSVLLNALQPIAPSIPITKVLKRNKRKLINTVETLLTELKGTALELILQMQADKIQWVVHPPKRIQTEHKQRKLDESYVQL